MADPAGASSRRADRRDLLPFQLLMGVTAGGIGGIVTVLGAVRGEFGFSGFGIGVMVASGVGGYFMIIGAWEAVLPVMFADRGAGVVMTGIAFTVVALPVMPRAPRRQDSTR